jgi:uncharacterized protein (UPF0548 family)
MMPTDREVRRILTQLAEVPCNYEPVGMTEEALGEAPRGYALHAYETELGRGDAIFESACAQLRRFGNYPASFTRVVANGETLEPGLCFATLATHFGFASLHPCRVLEVFGEDEPRGFGFALGTLPGHIGAGEERFMIRQDPADGVVRYAVRAISKPGGWLGLLSAPVFRSFQRRFARETQETMRARCGAKTSAVESHG